MKKCLFCTADIQEGVKVCPFCGKEQPVVKPQLGKRIKKIVLIVVLGLVGVCLFFVILGLVIQSTPSGKATSTARAIEIAKTEAMFTKTPSKTPKQTRTLVPSKTPIPSKTPVPSKTPTISPTPTVDPNLQVLMGVAGLSQEEAGAALELIRSAGFERVYDLNFEVETSKFKAYSADLGYTTLFRIAIAEGIITIIDDAKRTYYDASTGVIDSIKNFTLDSVERSTFQFLAQQIVLQVLKAPSTAEFPSGVFNADQWHLGRNHDLVSVQSWVDSQNSFGAMIRSKFTAQFSFSTQELQYLKFDGKVLFGKYQEP